MGKHGLVTWDDDPRACYDKTIRIIQQAETSSPSNPARAPCLR